MRKIWCLCLVISLVVKRNAVELLKRIIQFAIGGCKARVHRDTLHFGSVSAANINTGALLDIAEVHRVRTGTALVRDHGWLHMANKSPLGRPEEGMCLDIRCTGTSSKALGLVLDQQLADQRLAKRGGLLRTRALREAHLVPQDAGEGCVSVLALEGSGAVQHLIDKDTQSPPINCASVTAALDDLGCDILLGSNKRIRSEISNARLGINGWQGSGGVATTSARNHSRGTSGP